MPSGSSIVRGCQLTALHSAKALEAFNHMDNVNSLVKYLNNEKRTNFWAITSLKLASPFATPIASLLWEDAPLLGQHCCVSLFHHFAERKIKAKIENPDTVGDLDFNFSHKA